MKHRPNVSASAIIIAIASVILTGIVGVLANIAFSGVKDLSLLLQFLIGALVIALASAYITFKYQKRIPVKKKDQIMLIYAKEDTQVAKEVYSLLTHAGFKAWMDIQDLLPGQIWRESVESAIEESKLLVVLLSKSAFKNSGFVREELSLALDVLEKPREGFSSLIPVRIEPIDVPVRKLKEIQWVDFFSDNGRNRLLEAVSLLMVEPHQQSNLTET